MTVKARIALYILVTLIIGILLGGLINRALVQRRIGRAINRFNPAALEEIYQNALPRDAEESRRVREIIEKHLEAVSELRETYQNRMRDEFESTWERLDPLLGEEQKQQLLKRPFGPVDFFREARRFVDPRMRGRMIDETMDWLNDRLDLSPEQSREIAQRLRDPGIPFRPATPRPPLPGEKIDAPPREDPGGRYNRIMAEIRRNLEPILNDDQKEKLEKLMPELMKRMRPPFMDENDAPPPGRRRDLRPPIPRD